jgi:hypothetical protein
MQTTDGDATQLPNVVLARNQAEAECDDETCAYDVGLLSGLRAASVQLGDSLDSALESAYAWGWTDGLPIVPPTAERVARMLSGIRLDPATVIGMVPPRRGVLTLEKLAANAVMAGCRPEYLQVLVAVFQAMLDDRFNLYGLQATTGPHTPMILVNGPIRNAIGMNAGHNAFGPGNHANASIGRAARLVLLNVGGGVPGRIDKSTQGQPSKYTYCVAENEEDSPWEPLHVERGFDANTSTVTVFGGENPHNINDVGLSAEGLMTNFLDSMSTMGSAKFYRIAAESFLAFSPEHAALLASEGWSKGRIRQFLFERARKPVGLLKRGGMFGPEKLWPDWVDVRDDASLVPMNERADDIIVTVIGGAGRHSCFIPVFGSSRSVTRAIEPLE